MTEAASVVFQDVRLVTAGEYPVEETSVGVKDGKIAKIGADMSVSGVDGSGYNTLMPG